MNVQLKKTANMIAGKIAGAVILTAIAVSGVLAKGAGSSAVQMLTQDVSARTAAMGGAAYALPGTMASFHYNPAGMALIDGVEIDSMYRKGLAGDTNASMQAGMKLTGAAVGLSVLYYDTGSVEMYDTNGNAVSEIGQRDVAVALGAARRLNSLLSIGADVKFVSSKVFGYSASAMAVDLGAFYDGIIDIGISARNIGGSLTYIEASEPLPTEIGVGFAYSTDLRGHGLTAALDLPYKMNEKETHGLAGIEYRYEGLFALRGGYKMNLTNTSSKDEGKLSMGMGLTWGNYSIDYAIGIAKELDMPHHLSLRIKM